MRKYEEVHTCMQTVLLLVDRSRLHTEYNAAIFIAKFKTQQK